MVNCQKACATHNIFIFPSPSQSLLLLLLSPDTRVALDDIFLVNKTEKIVCLRTLPPNSNKNTNRTNKGNLQNVQNWRRWIAQMCTKIDVMRIFVFVWQHAYPMCAREQQLNVSYRSSCAKINKILPQWQHASECLPLFDLALTSFPFKSETCVTRFECVREWTFESVW